MFRQEENGDWIEYQIIPEREQVIRRMKPEEFQKYEDSLKARASLTAKELGDKIIADTQSKLNEITTAKAVEMEIK